MIEQVTLGELVDQAPVERAGNAKHVVLSMTRGMGLVPQTAVFDKVIASRDLSNYKVVQPNQLVVGIHIDEGALGFSAPDQKGIVSPAYTLWNLRNPNGIHTPYLHRFIRSEQAVSYFVSKYRETAERRGKLTREQFLALQIPLPPLAEQKRIAAILDAADALRAKRREALAQLDTLLQSTFLDMFGDPVTNPKGWDEIPLSDLCNHPDDIRCGPFGTQLQQSEYTTSGVPLWGIKHVNAGFSFPTHEFVSDSKAKKLASYSLMPGDLVMTRKGTIGNSHIYPRQLEPGIMHSDLLRLRLATSKAEPQFICAQFEYSRRIQRHLELMSPGAVMPGINVSKLKKLLVEAPPLELQRQYVSVAQAIEKEKLIELSHLAELESLFASLQSRAFRGEL